MKTFLHVNPAAQSRRGLFGGVAVATAVGCLIQPTLALNGPLTSGTETKADLSAATAPTSDWLGLSGELNGLTATLQDQMGPTTVGGLIRGQIQQTGDFNASTPTGEDILGLVLDDAKLFAKGSIGEFDWRVMFDFAENLSAQVPDFDPDADPMTDNDIGVQQTWLGAQATGYSSSYNAALQEAYATWNFAEDFGLTFGRFRAHRSFSSTVFSEQLLFQNRTLIGELGYRFDEGLQLHGNYGGPLSWYISAQNGLDGQADDLELLGRVEWAFGAGAGHGEGAIVMPGGNQNGDQLQGAIGATYGDDGNFGSYYGVDFVGRMQRLFLNAEYFAYDDDWAPLLSGALGTAGAYTDGPSFYSATVGYLLPGDQWEVAARYQDLDDTNDTTALSFGVNYYVAGHNAKWQLNYTNVSSDADTLDGNLISLGLTLGLEGY